MGPTGSSRAFFRGGKGSKRPFLPLDRPPFRGWKLPAFFLFAGVLVVAFFLAQKWFVDLKFRPLVITELSKVLQTPVQLRSIRVDLLGQVVLNDLSFTLPGSPWEVGVSMQKAEVDLALYRLLIQRQPLDRCLDSLAFNHPRILLKFKGIEPGLHGPPPPGALSEPRALPPLPLIQKVSVRNGLFLVQAGSVPREILDRVQLRALASKGNVWGIDLEAGPPEENQRGRVKFHGNFRPEEWKASGKVDLENWPLVFAGLALKDLAGWTLEAGEISLASPVVFRLDRGWWFDAQAAVKDAVVRSPDPSSIRLARINGRVNLRPKEMTFPGGLAFQLGETPFTAQGTLPLDGRPISASASTEKFLLASLFSEVLKQPDHKVAGTGSAGVTFFGSLRDPGVEAKAVLGPSQIGAMEVDSFSVKASYRDGVLRLEEALGKLYDGKFAAQGSFPLEGEGPRPVSLTAQLMGLEAAKLPGLKGFFGKTDAELRWGGTLDSPLLSAGVRMALSRGKEKDAPKVHLKGNLTLTEGKVSLQGSLNEKASLEGSALRKGDFWEVLKFSYASGRKTGRLTVGGTWPVKKDLPVDLKVSGTGLEPMDIPFFPEIFPGLSGKLDLKGSYGGTRQDPRWALELSSAGIQLAALPPEPLEISLLWVPGSLEFKRLVLGRLIQVQGTLGLSPEGPLDLKVEAAKAPLAFLGGVLGWVDLPKPFQGSLTGKVRLSGTRKNPILSGNEEILLESLQVGAWRSDKVEALLNLEEGKLLVRKLRFTQKEGSLSVLGSWDSRSRPGSMQLRFSPKDFSLGSGPALTGEFTWTAQTQEPFWRNWTGTLSSPAFYLKDPKGKSYRFTDLTLPAESKEMVLTSRVRLGRAITGSAGLDLSGSTPRVKARLQVAPVQLSEAPELLQFLPPEMKASGRVSGDLTLKEGTFEELPMTGKFRVSLGSIWDYRFDSLDLEIGGDKKRISPILSLAQAEAKYSLSGTLESPKNFLDPEAKVVIHGPVQRLKLSALLALAGVDPKKHKVGGLVDGDLSITGTLGAPLIGFTVSGEDLRFDPFEARSAKLDFTFDVARGKLNLGKNEVQLPKGTLRVEKGTAYLDPSRSGSVRVEVSGSAKDVPVAVFNLSSDILLKGRVSLEDQPDRPTLEGTLLVLDRGVLADTPGLLDNLMAMETVNKALDLLTGPDARGRKPVEKPAVFEQVFAYKKGKLEFKGSGSKGPQLAGSVDLSEGKKIFFQDLHLENSPGTFSVDGVLDLEGRSNLVSDAKDIQIQQVGKWLFKDFPLKGKGGYHLIFEGNLDDPLMTISLSVGNGKVGGLNFDLLSGLIKSKDNTLFLGTAEAPLALSRKDLFSFNVSGKVPMAFTKLGWLKVKDREMDVRAEMTRGDFSLILLAGLAEEASGPMDLSARVSGTLDNPILTMDLDLKDCRMVPPDRIIVKSAEEIRGRIKVRNNRMAVEDLNARIGQGRVFFNSPPLEESQMLLKGFSPTFLDLRMRTIGEHGVLLSIPTIMRKGEWGEVHFYGATPEDPLLIRGPIAGPNVIGTAFLDTGRYTFPPFPEKTESGKNIEFKGLAGVIFDLKLASGKDAWYANEFNSQYLELKVDPGKIIHLRGKDIDKTPLEPGIKTSGEAGSHLGFLRYLGQEFKLEEASLFIPKGKPPRMKGRARQRLLDVEVVSAGGVRRTDVDIWVDFNGTFGTIDFKLDSSPKFSGDPETHQKLLLSYIVFGRDMTGLSREALAEAYEQKFGDVMVDAGWDYLKRISSNAATKAARNVFQELGNVDVSVDVDPGKLTGLASQQVVTDASGNTLPGQSVPLVEVKLRRYIDPKLSMFGSVGLNKDLGTERAGVGGQLGLGYDVTKELSLGAAVGRRDDNQTESKFEMRYSVPLPDIIAPKKGDVRAPQFERFDIYSSGPGKFQVSWVTDEVTKSEIKVVDEEGKEVRTIQEQGQPKYRHEMVLDQLERDKDYRIRILVRDPNGNETVREERASAASQ